MPATANGLHITAPRWHPAIAFDAPDQRAMLQAKQALLLRVSAREKSLSTTPTRPISQ